MAPESWWTTSITWLVWIVVMSVAVGWFSASRRRKAVAPGRMVHPLTTAIIGFAGLILFAGAAILSNLFPNGTATWWTTTLFVGFALLSLPMVSGYYLEQHQISDEGLAFRNFAGIRKHLRWSDVQSVRCSYFMNWIRLETRTGTVACVRMMLTGLPDFSRAVLHHVPRQAIDPATLHFFEATAAGHAPALA